MQTTTTTTSGGRSPRRGSEAGRAHRRMSTRTLCGRWCCGSADDVERNHTLGMRRGDKIKSHALCLQEDRVPCVHPSRKRYQKATSMAGGVYEGEGKGAGKLSVLAVAAIQRDTLYPLLLHM